MKNIFNKRFITKTILIILAGFILVYSTQYYDLKHFRTEFGISLDYKLQNLAFTGYEVCAYVPYNLLDKKVLANNLKAYKEKTGIIITQEDIKEFLADDKLPNGTPKTYKNSGDKKIYDYVLRICSQAHTVLEIK